MKRRLLQFAVAVLLLMISSDEPSAFALERLEPPEGCYLGFVMGQNDTVARLSSRLGITPAVYVRFFGFPLSPTDRANLTNFLGEVVLNGGIALITLQPWQGLDTITQDICADLGALCFTYEALGIEGILIRFAHEMNGNWYPWGQQPLLYKEKFRLVAQNVHSVTTRTGLLWAPNYGVGYPFGNPRALPGTPDFAILDTDGDGVLSQADDMYEPYYPGDDVVDWVGMTVYHWGVDYPWFENELPLPNSFANSLIGMHQGITPNFYAHYCADGVHYKPMAVPETSAFYNTQQGGPNEFDLKEAWWRQVFNIGGDTSSAWDVAQHFPKLKCIAWFDQFKQEVEARNSWIDWRVSADQRISAAFVADVRTPRLGQPYFLTAQELHWQRSGYAITASILPTILPLKGSIPLSLNVKAAADCDLVIELLDKNLQSHASTRIPVTNTVQTVSATLFISQPLVDGDVYRWNTFLTPPSLGYDQAMTCYKGPNPVAREFDPCIQISAFPPVITGESNFNVRVKYVATEPGTAVVRVLDLASRQIGVGSIAVDEGDGRAEVALRLPGNVRTGTYWLEAFLSESSGNSNTPVVYAQRLAVQARDFVDQDIIAAAAEPSIVPVGEVFRFEVGYAARTNRDLHIDLFDSGTNYLASAFQAVPAGSGVCDMRISFPQTSPGEHSITVFMTPSGLSWMQAVAWGKEQHIAVVSPDYVEWIESHWGHVLQNDPVDPQDDPDCDGGSNNYEFATQTDPRNANDILKLSIAKRQKGLAVSWPSVAGLAYQLLESPNASAGSWTSVGGTMIGNAGVLEVVLKPDRAAAFYRLQVLP